MIRTVLMIGRYALAGLLLFWLVMAALGGSSSFAHMAAHGVPGNNSFTLDDFEPTANSVSTPLTATVVLTYSANVDATTVASNTVALYSIQRILLNADYGVTGKTVTVTPPQPFFPGELIYTSATQFTQDITGANLLTPVVWQFQTVAGSSGGALEAGVNFGAINHRTYSVAWADFDGDGDLDLTAANFGRQSAVYHNVARQVSLFLPLIER